MLVSVRSGPYTMLLSARFSRLSVLVLLRCCCCVPSLFIGLMCCACTCWLNGLLYLRPSRLTCFVVHRGPDTHLCSPDVEPPELDSGSEETVPHSTSWLSCEVHPGRDADTRLGLAPLMCGTSRAVSRAAEQQMQPWAGCARAERVGARFIEQLG